MGSNQYPTLQDAYIKGILDHRIPSKNLVIPRLMLRDITLSETAEWDVIYGGTPLAHFVAKDAPAHIQQPRKVKKLLTKLCFCREKRRVPESVLALLRAEGQSANGLTPEQRARMAETKITDVVNDLAASVDMLQEWAGIQAMLGTLAWDRDGVKINIDYGIRATHKITATTAWTDHTNADVLGNFDECIQAMIDDGAPPAVEALMRTNTYNHITHNSAIRDLLKTERGVTLVETGNIDQIRKVKLVPYDVSYMDDVTGNTSFMLPEGKVIFVAPTSHDGSTFANLLSGPAKANGFMPGRFGKVWDTEDPDDTWVLAGEYFVPALKFPDNIVILTAYPTP